ncbi:ABC transporter substrate-binding protein [bacterium]|nr:ABC transporter substrate-binding protein [bacterium]
MPLKPSSSFRTSRILALALVLSTVASPGAWAKPGTLRLGLQDRPSTLDPALASNVPAIAVSHWLYNGLVTFDDKARIVPELAERYQVSKDGKVLEFTLRKGVRFHDGKPLTSADVAYSLTRLFWPETKSPGSSFYRAIAGSEEVLAGSTRTLSGISTPDAETVVIRLSAPQPTFLQVLGLNYAAIVPQGAGERPGFSQAPVGTGPFRFGTAVTGERIEFSRNPHYFKPGLPKLDGITLQLGLNEQVETLRFERGELDAIGLLRGIGAAEYARLARDPRHREHFITGPDMATYYVGMNTRMTPFNDPRVREAVAMAIDKAKIVRLVNGRGLVSQGFLPPGLPGATPDRKTYPYDPARAKQLLAEAGYPNGFESTYWCSSSQTSLKTAQAIHHDLAKVGIRLKLKPLAFPTFLAGVGREKMAPIFSGNWSQDFPDASNFLGTIFSKHAIRPVRSLNTTFFEDDLTNRLLDQAAITPDDTARFGLYQQAERRVMKLAPVVPLYHPMRSVLARPEVSGLVLHPVWPVDAERISVR